MEDRKLTVLRVVGYVLFFLFFFVVFLYLKFPYNAIKDTVLQKLETGSSLRVEMDDFAPDKLTGVEARGIRVYALKGDRTFLVVQLDRVRARLAILPLLTGRVRLAVDLDAYQGNMEGQFSKSGRVSDLDLRFSNINLGLYDLTEVLGFVGKLKLDGILGGLITGHFDGADLNATSAEAQLQLQGMKLAESSIYGITTPELSFEPATLKLELDKRALKIVEGKLTGDQMEVELGGRMTLRDDLMKSNYNYFLKFKPSAAFEDQFGPYLSMMKNKDRGGFYRINLTGSPSSPRFR